MWYGPPDIPRGVSGWGWPAVSLAAVDSPRDVWWIVSRTNTVLLLDPLFLNYKSYPLFTLQQSHDKQLIYIYIYTARELCAITLVVPPFCLKASWNLCQSQYKAPGNVKDTSDVLLTKFYGWLSFLSIPGQPSFSGVLISPIVVKAVRRIYVDHIRLWAVVVCKLHSENIVLIMPTAIQPVFIENDVKFPGLGFSHREEMSRTAGVS